jgi:hypothetical protein
VKQICRLTWYEVNDKNIVTVADTQDGTIEELLPIIHLFIGTDVRWRLSSVNVEDS